jgi:NAD+ kinase
MKIRNILVVYAKPTSQEQKNTLSLVKNTIKRHGIKYSVSEREKLNKKMFASKDLVIAVGGDGTFLRASHYILDETPLFGVNSDTESKEGFFMISNRRNFNRKFNIVLKHNYRVRKLHRLEAYINNKKISELALNEFYISSAREYRTARYFITLRGKIERQKSSGVIISTAAGSYAWMKSAGGKQIPLHSDNFEYMVREPYCGRITAKCGLVSGILPKDERVVVEFEAGKGILIADSLSMEHRFNAKDKVVVKMSEKPLHYVSL